jgi:hypothetical protein
MNTTTNLPSSASPRFLAMTAAMLMVLPAMAAEESDTSQLNSAERTNAVETGILVVQTRDGICEITIDTSEATNLTDWAREKLAPVLVEWQPKIAAMLTSDDFTAPDKFSVTIKPGDGVAYASGTRITANSNWIERELEREAVGSIVHEVVHVVQQYRGRRRDPDFNRPPGWLVEGIPDYIRWFLYEPESHGADIVWMRGRRNVRLEHEASYRITANFLNHVIENYDKDKSLITKLNAACRQGKYTDELWQEWTDKTLNELSEEWKTSVQAQLADNPQS